MIPRRKKVNLITKKKEYDYLMLFLALSLVFNSVLPVYFAYVWGAENICVFVTLCATGTVLFWMGGCCLGTFFAEAEEIETKRELEIEELEK